MSAFRYSSAAALIFVAVGSTCPILAQPSPSEIDNSHHVITPFPPGNSEAALLQRLQNHHLSNTLRSNGILGGADLDKLKQHPDELTELLRKHGLNPEAIEAIKQNPALLDLAIDRIKNGEGLPEGASVPSTRLNNALKELGSQPKDSGQQAQPRPQTIPPPVEGERLGQTLRPNELAVEDTGVPKPLPASPQATGSEETPRLPLGQKLQGWAERLQSLNPQWRNSPAFQHAVQSLAKNIGHEDPKWQKLSEASEHLRDRWSEWSKSSGLEKFWASRRFQVPNVPPMEGMSKFTRAVAENTPGNFNMPQVGAPQLGAPQFGGGILSALAWLIGAVAGAVCLRQLWLYLQEKNSEFQRKQSLLNAWPVDPSRVNSREELVRAYEFLALSRLGLAVKSWNHLAIAAGLGNTADPLRRNAALSLTNAYEQARYAPLEEAMPKEVIVEARHQLCLLAGVKGA